MSIMVPSFAFVFIMQQSPNGGISSLPGPQIYEFPHWKVMATSSIFKLQILSRFLPPRSKTKPNLCCNAWDGWFFFFFPLHHYFYSSTFGCYVLRCFRGRVFGGQLEHSLFASLTCSDTTQFQYKSNS